MYGIRSPIKKHRHTSIKPIDTCLHFLLLEIDNMADNIAGNNADNKVDMCDSALYNIARSCGLDPHTGIRLNPERASI